MDYYLLLVNRAGGKKSDRRRVWHFVERERRPREHRDLEGRNVWDSTYNHKAAGSDVWLRPGFSFSTAQSSRMHNIDFPSEVSFSNVPCSLRGVAASERTLAVDLWGHPS